MDNSLSFRTIDAFERWLAKNHGRSNGIWLRMYKKDSGSNILKGSEIVDALLCYGWITGQARRGNGEYVLWWLCPRRKKSLWSEINKGRAKKLIKEGRMKPSGMKEVAEAKKDGRWRAAYPPQKTAKLPADFLKKVSKNRRAMAFLKTMNKSDTYAIIFRLHNTRDKRRRAEKIDKIVSMLEQGMAFH